MRTLGIESTAHTFGAGVVEDGRVISNVRNMYIPDEGGIHPREAADHHVNVGNEVVRMALLEADTRGDELDLVTFSRGPGLGPCLRVGATIARVLSLKHNIPIIGANHCVAHLEIGSMLGAGEPVLLYASGGNTQIIALVRGRYRVLGETLDIGIGNMLDKFGREIGIPYHAGPKIEMLAKGEEVEGVFEEGISIDPVMLELPYSVKGMDIQFSGLMTAALNLWKKGEDLPSVCYSVQETSFAMLCEVTERAMAHIGCDEVLLGGGVACNSRLKEMVGIMAVERGGTSFAPPRDLAVDNGAMIAYLGEKMFLGGIRHSLPDTVIDQRFRTDQVDVTWKSGRDLKYISTPGTVSLETGGTPGKGDVLGRGAEATTTVEKFGDLDCVSKSRIPKGYRSPVLEARLTNFRIKNEVKMLKAIRDLGIRTPYVMDIDPPNRTIKMELLKGPRLAGVLNLMNADLQKIAMREMGRIIGVLHSNGYVHGDLTTSNFILTSEENGLDLILIDCSLAERTEELEKMGVDLRLFFEVFSSTHSQILEMEAFWDGYDRSNSKGKQVREKLDDITKRGRYITEKWSL